MTVAAIFGATGGIGAALVEEADVSGRFSSVLALSRRSDPPFDLHDEATIRAASSCIRDIGSR